MKLYSLLLIASVSTLFTACAPAAKDRSRSSTANISTSTVDGTYVKIYGGRKSYFVFRGGATNTFFTEFEGRDGTTIRADGTWQKINDRWMNP